MKRSINIKIIRNCTRFGYEVYISGIRAPADEEAGVIKAMARKLVEELPIPDKTIWIG